MTVKISNAPMIDFWPGPQMQVLSLSKSADEFLDDKAGEIEANLTSRIFGSSGQVVIDNAQETPDSLALRFAQRFADEAMNAAEDEILSEVLWQSGRTLTSNSKPMNFQVTLSLLNKFKLPEPSASGRIVKYVPSDCIMAAKDLMSDFGDLTKREFFCANFGAYFDGTMPAKVLAFENENAFEEFKNELASQQAMFTGNISVTDNQLISDFLSLKLSEMAEGILVRLPEHILDDAHSSNEPFSFARVLENTIRQFVNSHDECFEVPVNLSEGFFMTNLFMVNMENISRSSDAEFKKCMRLHSKGFNQARRLKLVSNKALKKADKVARANSPQRHKVKTTRNNAIVRASRRKFSGKPATSRELLKMIQKVIENRTTSQMTSNTFIQTKPTFMRPNRRDPNNINLLGKMKSVRYRPDLHIFIDSSGSISEEMWRDAVGTIIFLAKKLDVNLFITSFSHIISQTTQLQVQGRKVSQIYQDFLKIDKVTGGTDFTLVWDKVQMLDKLNKKNNRSFQMNFMLTDFEFSPPSRRVFTSEMACVKNMFYLPISVGKRDYEHLVRSADWFAKSMEKLGDENIRKRMLLP